MEYLFKIRTSTSLIIQIKKSGIRTISGSCIHYRQKWNIEKTKFSNSSPQHIFLTFFRVKFFITKQDFICSCAPVQFLKVSFLHTTLDLSLVNLIFCVMLIIFPYFISFLHDLFLYIC